MAARGFIEKPRALFSSAPVGSFPECIRRLWKPSFFDSPLNSRPARRSCEIFQRFYTVQSCTLSPLSMGLTRLPLLGSASFYSSSFDSFRLYSSLSSPFFSTRLCSTRTRVRLLNQRPCRFDCFLKTGKSFLSCN